MSGYEDYIEITDDGKVSIGFPKEIEEGFERNNRKMDWINEKNSKPSIHGGTRPVCIKDVKKFIDDINNLTSNFIGLYNNQVTRESLKQCIDCLYDKFLFGDEYDIHVEVNI